MFPPLLIPQNLLEHPCVPGLVLGAKLQKCPPGLRTRKQDPFPPGDLFGSVQPNAHFPSSSAQSAHLARGI